MTSVHPTFSVVVPTYNRADLIAATLRSVLAQTDADFELLVIDDGSTDATAAVVGAITDPRLRYIPITNGERGRARNWGTRESRGRYVTFLDSDDLLLPHHLAEARATIARARDPEWLVLSYITRSFEGQETTRRLTAPLAPQLIRGNVLSCNGVFIRADIARQHPFSEVRALSASEDWLLWLQLAARYPAAVSAEPTSIIIDHAGRSVRRGMAEQLAERTRLLVAGLRADQAVVTHYGERGIRRVEAHMLTYTALHLALAGQRRGVLSRLLRGALLSPAELFQRRTLATLKHLIFAAPAA